MPEKQDDGRGLAEVLRELAESSSLHGIPKVVFSRQWSVKVLWSLLTLATTCLMGYQLADLVTEFHSKPVITRVKLGFSQLRYPDVTLCNMNPVKKSKIDNAPDLEAVIFKQKEKPGIEELLNDEPYTTNKPNNLPDSTTGLGDFLNETSLTNSSSDYSDNYDYLYDYAFNMTDFNTTEFYDELRELGLFTSPRDAWTRQWDTIRAGLKEAPREMVEDIGHQKEDVVITFTFAGRNQYVKDIKQFTSSTYGNCFKISSRKYKAWRSGPDHGIKLILNLEQSEYVSEFASGVGLRMVLNDPGSLELPSEEGFTISGGFDTSIGLRMVRISRLGEPYGHCSDGEQFYKKYGKKYSIAACMEFCRVERVIRQCGCVPADSPEMFTPQTLGVQVCRIFPDGDALCELMVEIALDQGDTDCDCPSACSQTVYEKAVSGGFWPAEEYLSKILMRKVCSKTTASMATACQQHKNGSFDPSKYVNNFLTVRIYYEDLNYEILEEVPMYEPVRFISDVGGTLGLFMGVSVLSLVEILQLLLELGLYCSRRFRRRHHDDGKAANATI